MNPLKVKQPVQPRAESDPAISEKAHLKYLKSLSNMNARHLCPRCDGMLSFFEVDPSVVPTTVKREIKVELISQ
jgi:hypothetical protein